MHLPARAAGTHTGCASTTSRSCHEDAPHAVLLDHGGLGPGRLLADVERSARAEHRRRGGVRRPAGDGRRASRPGRAGRPAARRHRRAGQRRRPSAASGCASPRAWRTCRRAARETARTSRPPPNADMASRKEVAPARDRSLAKDERSSVKKAKRAAKRTISRARHGVSEIDSARRPRQPADLRARSRARIVGIGRARRRREAASGYSRPCKTPN